MGNTITVFLTLDSTAMSLLQEMNTRLINLEKLGAQTLATIDDILSDVTAETTVEQSAIVLLNGLSASLKTAGNDPVKVAAVRSMIQANTKAMAAAIAANTPAVAPTGPTVIPNPISITNGSTLQLAVDDATGADITATATYASADQTTASVNTAGLVTGNKVGTTTITVTDAAGNATQVPVTVS